MAQTGPSYTRAIKVFRARVASLWTAANGKVSWPETEFQPPASTDPPAAPAAILRVQPNRTFEEPLSFGGTTSSGQGSMSLVYGVQNRPGALAAQEAAETDIRAIASVTQNDNSEDVWTLPGLEVNPGVTPQGIPENLAKAFTWTQYVVPFRFAEGYV